MEGALRALANKKTQWKEHFCFTGKLVQQKLMKYYTEVTPMTAMHFISAHILNPFRKLPPFRMWHKAIDVNPNDEIFYTTRYQDAILKHMENDYCTKQWPVLVNILDSLPSSNLRPSVTASGSPEPSFDYYDLPSDDDEFLTPNNVAVTTPGQSNCTASIITASKCYLNLPPEVLKNWWQINWNLNDYSYDTMEISSTFWIPDITNWWQQQEEMHSKYANLSKVACDILSIIRHGVTVGAKISLWQYVVGWRRSKTQGETVREKVVVRQFVWAYHWTLAGTDPELDTTITENGLEMKKVAVYMKFALNCQGSWLFGYLAGQPKRTCGLEAILLSKQADNWHRMHHGHISDRQSILVTLSTWWCSCS